MQLSISSLKNIDAYKAVIPAKAIFELPEKVLQFGTGVLLRGLPDYFIDKANRAGVFNGRIVAVKTTSKGDTDDFDKQNCLYTLCVRGVEDGKKIEENIINSSITRVLHAQNEWRQILDCAHNKSLQIIISNTTEVGIKLKEDDDIKSNPPGSYPGKLLAFLYNRFIAFKGSLDSGFVIIPTELLPGNGDKLKEIITQLAQINKLETAFTRWVSNCNYFCNSLVDRIVTGMPDNAIKNDIENELGYKDDLLNVCEVYKLWAIEGDEHVKKVLSFAEADEGVKIEPDIEIYRELKLRLLNGTHTLSCGIAFLAGIDSVKNAMDDALMKKYVADLMQNEIGISITFLTDSKIIHSFIVKVLDRFRNPHINHRWKNITLNYTGKIKLRCIPLLISYYKKYNTVPELFALGFAAYLFFIKAVKQDGTKFYGKYDNEFYLIEDETAEYFYELWQRFSVEELVKEVLKNKNLWGEDIGDLPDFQQSVVNKLNSIINYGMTATLQNYLS